MGIEWIKDFFTGSGDLTARFYRVPTEPIGKYELMYDKCIANISVYYNKGRIKIGSISFSLADRQYDNLFRDQVKSEYKIPKYVIDFILYYFRTRG